MDKTLNVSINNDNPIVYKGRTQRSSARGLQVNRHLQIYHTWTAISRTDNLLPSNLQSVGGQILTLTHHR